MNLYFPEGIDREPGHPRTPAALLRSREAVADTSFVRRLEDRQFQIMSEAFVRTGGLASGDQLARRLRRRLEQPLSTIARWIVERRVVSFEWQGRTLLPLFQFESGDVTLRGEVTRVVNELNHVFDSWELAAHLDMTQGSTAGLPADHAERAVYVATGSVELGGVTHGAGRLLVLGPSASRMSAVERSNVMVLGGAPIGERFVYWNFVSSSKNRLARAAADWKAGRMKLPDADDAEFMPLPDDPAPAGARFEGGTPDAPLQPLGSPATRR